MKAYIAGLVWEVLTSRQPPPPPLPPVLISDLKSERELNVTEARGQGHATPPAAEAAPVVPGNGTDGGDGTVPPSPPSGGGESGGGDDFSSPNDTEGSSGNSDNGDCSTDGEPDDPGGDGGSGSGSDGSEDGGEHACNPADSHYPPESKKGSDSPGQLRGGVTQNKSGSGPEQVWKTAAPQLIPEGLSHISHHTNQSVISDQSTSTHAPLLLLLRFCLRAQKKMKSVRGPHLIFTTGRAILHRYSPMYDVAGLEC